MLIFSIDAMSTREVCVSAPVNVAITKYWGKLDELNIHPVNSSISVTLNQAQLMTTTRLITGPDLMKSVFSLNGRVYDEIPGRIKDVIIIAQLRARLAGRIRVFPHMCIETVNSFPTAAGLASSASGLAALAFGLAKLYGLDEDIPSLARRGSGSACRSLYGGFVHWSMPDNPAKYLTSGLEPLRSSINNLYPAAHWPSLKVLICVTSNRMKPIGSTDAMQQTVRTSQLFRRARAETVKEHEKLLLTALRDRNFAQFAQVAMQESNQLHSLCLDTWPPCIYLNEVSVALMNWARVVNQYCQHTVVAYTFDAGPNAFLFAEEPNLPFLLYLLVCCFGVKTNETEPNNLSSFGDHTSTALNITDPTTNGIRRIWFRGISYPMYSKPVDPELLAALPKNEGGVLHIISTEVGDGPTLYDENDALTYPFVRQVM